MSLQSNVFGEIVTVAMLQLSDLERTTFGSVMVPSSSLSRLRMKAGAHEMVGGVFSFTVT